MSKPKNGTNGGGGLFEIFYNGGSRPSSYVVGGYPKGYTQARSRTWREYGSGAQGKIPEIQDRIEERRIQTPAPRTTKQAIRQRERKVTESIRRTALAKTQAQYGKGATGQIPAIQDLIEARRNM